MARKKKNQILQLNYDPVGRRRDSQVTDWSGGKEVGKVSGRVGEREGI